MLQTAVVAVWVSCNVLSWRLRWDPAPFQALNLAFSVQAAYAAPLILLAQRRKDDRDRLHAEADRSVRARTQADADFVAREVASLRLELAAAASRADLEVFLSSIDERVARALA